MQSVGFLPDIFYLLVSLSNKPPLIIGCCNHYRSLELESPNCCIMNQADSYSSVGLTLPCCGSFVQTQYTITSYAVVFQQLYKHTV